MNLPENYRNIVVVGASAGGVEAIIEMVKGIPRGYPGAIFIVQHTPAYAKSNLDLIVQNHTDLLVKKGTDGEEITGGTIYVPRADHHLIMEAGRVVISKGPRENRFRPAVDTLFRSAAHAYRERVVGVVLSGALNDGTSGMWMINRLGGTAIVQEPGEALFPDMPKSVMQYTEVDHVLPVARMGPLLFHLASQKIGDVPVNRVGKMKEQLLEIELGIAKGKNGLIMGLLEQGTPSALACPECHGALTQFEEGKLLRFRCHTGHAHTAESLLASIQDNVEKSMWEVMRGMEENNILLESMAQQLERDQQHTLASRYREQSRRFQQQAKAVQEAILENNLSDA